MFHCHILDHEDAGMMKQFIVVEPGSIVKTPEPTATLTVAKQKTVTSDIAGFKLEDLVISVGTKVTWVNQDSARHTTTSGTSPEPSNIWNSDFLDKGNSSSHVFLEPGTFPYFCRIHPFMTATVTVVEAER